MKLKQLKTFRRKNKKNRLPGFAHSGVKDWSLISRVGSDEQDPIGLLDSGDGGVQQVVGPLKVIERNITTHGHLGWSSRRSSEDCFMSIVKKMNKQF